MVEQYKAYAAECLRLAQQAKDPKEKEELFNLAAGWLQMAEVTETAKRPDGADRGGGS